MHIGFKEKTAVIIALMSVLVVELGGGMISIGCRRPRSNAFVGVGAEIRFCTGVTRVEQIEFWPRHPLTAQKKGVSTTYCLGGGGN